MCRKEKRKQYDRWNRWTRWTGADLLGDRYFSFFSDILLEVEDGQGDEDGDEAGKEVLEKDEGGHADTVEDDLGHHHVEGVEEDKQHRHRLGQLLLTHLNTFFGHKQTNKIEKSRIRQTLNLSTDAGSSTDNFFPLALRQVLIAFYVLVIFGPPPFVFFCPPFKKKILKKIVCRRRCRRRYRRRRRRCGFE